MGVEIWAYCLMPNHVYVVAVPSTKKSLSDAGITGLRDVAVGARDR
jgi:REP element-mobilizing transposase RayT